MPQYISEKGEWQAADLAAQEELKLKGVKTLGIKVKEITPGNPTPEYPVMAEAQAELPKAGKDNKFPETRVKGVGMKKEGK